jgi:ATP-binding cassette, subfamily B, bacterial MsbA
MLVYLKFFKYFKYFIRKFLLANIFMILSIIFNVISLVMIMPFMDLLFNKNEQAVKKNVEFSLLNLKEYITSKISFLVTAYPITDLLLYLCILIIITFVLKNIFSFFQTYFMSSVEQGIVQKIQLELYSHIHDLPISFFVNEKKGNLISRIINDVKIINDSLVAVINSAFRDPPQIITYSIMLFVFNWKLSLFIFALSPILGFVLSKIGDNLKKKSISTQEHISEVTSLLDETLAAMRIVKAFNMEKYEVNRFHKATDNYYGAMIGLIRRRALASPVTEIIGIVFITMILYFIGIQIVSGDGYMSPGAFVLSL